MWDTLRSPIKLLSSLQTHSSDKSYTYDRLYRNLYNPSLFMLAYQNIYASPGNMTKGSDGNTIDAMSLNRIEGSYVLENILSHEEIAGMDLFEVIDGDLY